MIYGSKSWKIGLALKQKYIRINYHIYVSKIYFQWFWVTEKFIFKEQEKLTDLPWFGQCSWLVHWALTFICCPATWCKGSVLFSWRSKHDLLKIFPRPWVRILFFDRFSTPTTIFVAFPPLSTLKLTWGFVNDSHKWLVTLSDRITSLKK